jgi:hypothetical protein
MSANASAIAIRPIISAQLREKSDSSVDELHHDRLIAARFDLDQSAGREPARMKDILGRARAPQG